jgi:hypothetical protein
VNRISFPLEPENRGPAVADLQAGLRFLIDKGFSAMSPCRAWLPTSLEVPTRHGQGSNYRAYKAKISVSSVGRERRVSHHDQDKAHHQWWMGTVESFWKAKGTS